jgi:hypothetical protein
MSDQEYSSDQEEKLEIHSGTYFRETKNPLFESQNYPQFLRFSGNVMEERLDKVEASMVSITEGINALLKASGKEEVKPTIKLATSGGIFGQTKTIDLSSNDDLEKMIADHKKKSRGQHEKEFLVELLEGALKNKDINSVILAIQQRLLYIKKSEAFGWKAMEKLDQAKELGMNEEDVRLMAALGVQNKPKSYSKQSNSKPYKKKGKKGGKDSSKTKKKD